MTAYRLVGSDGRTYASVVKGTLGGHRRGRVYGRLDCASAARAIARGGYVGQRVFFATEVDAVGAGYRPCAVCLSSEYARWKANTPAANVRPVTRRPDGRLAAFSSVNDRPTSPSPSTLRGIPPNDADDGQHRRPGYNR